jgi:hypothetical protein
MVVPRPRLGECPTVQCQRGDDLAEFVAPDGSLVRTKASARAVAKRLVDRHCSHPGEWLWEVGEGLWCVLRTTMAGNRLMDPPSSKDIEAAKRLTEGLVWPTDFNRLSRLHQQVRPHGFALIRRTRSGKWRFAPPYHNGDTSGAAMLAVRVPASSWGGWPVAGTATAVPQRYRSGCHRRQALVMQPLMVCAWHPETGSATSRTSDSTKPCVTRG